MNKRGWTDVHGRYIGYHLRALRYTNGLTQYQLSYATGIPIDSIKKMEAHDTAYRSGAGPRTLRVLADVYGTDWWERMNDLLRTHPPITNEPVDAEEFKWQSALYGVY